MPPDALREFHKAALELFTRIVELAESQDPDSIALPTHMKFDSSAFESLEELDRIKVDVERTLMGLDPEIHAYFSENRCGE